MRFELGDIVRIKGPSEWDSPANSIWVPEMDGFRGDGFEYEVHGITKSMSSGRAYSLKNCETGNVHQWYFPEAALVLI